MIKEQLPFEFFKNLIFLFFIIINQNFMQISDLKKIIYFLINSCLVFLGKFLIFIILNVIKKYVHCDA